MRLRGRNFAPVANASGACNFFGEGYWYHRPWKLLRRLTFEKCGFGAKTTTLGKNLGNMPMKENSTSPKEWIPKCIIVKPFSGVALNAVGLSGPGAEWLLEQGHWQRLKKPFFLSFMSIAGTKDARLKELRKYCTLLEEHLPPRRHPYGLQLNFSCPNTGHDLSERADEAGEVFDIAGRLQIPLAAKFNAVVPASLIAQIGNHKECDCLIMGNTIPWGELPDEIDWEGLFGSNTSPLIKRGFENAGGLSGPPLRAIHCERIRQIRDCGYTKPIYGCGGVNSPEAVHEYFKAGADGVEFGAVAITHPRQTGPIIRTAYELFS